MEDKIKIEIGAYERDSEVEISYEFITGTIKSPIMFGSIEKEIYSMFGSILWDKVLDAVGEIVSDIVDNPRTKEAALGEIELTVDLDTPIPTEELVDDFVTNKYIIGEEAMNLKLKNILLMCNKCNIRPTLCSLDFKQLMKL